MKPFIVLSLALAATPLPNPSDVPPPRVGAGLGEAGEPPLPPPPSPSAEDAEKSAAVPPGAGARKLTVNPLDPRDVAVTSSDPAMRRYMAAVLARQADAHSFVLLMQLAGDGDTGVRTAALEAAYGHRCKREKATLCTALLAAFMRDGEREIAWQARDWLLDRDLDLALEDADKAYKLDLLAKLGGSPTIPEGAARHLLRCLSADADIDVQDSATWLLEQAP